MSVFVAVMVPNYLIQLSCARAPKWSPQNITFDLKGTPEFTELMRALKSAPDSAFRIWTDSTSTKKKANTRVKNARGVDRVNSYMEEDWDDYSFNPEDNAYPNLSVESVIRSIADGNGNYNKSFFGTKGPTKGNLYHQFKHVKIPGHTSKSAEDFYIKFIAPAGVINEKEVYDVFKDNTTDGRPIPITLEEVKPGSNYWEVVSYHGEVDED